MRYLITALLFTGCIADAQLRQGMDAISRSQDANIEDANAITDSAIVILKWGAGLATLAKAEDLEAPDMPMDAVSNLDTALDSIVVRSGHVQDIAQISLDYKGRPEQPIGISSEELQAFKTKFAMLVRAWRAIKDSVKAASPIKLPDKAVSSTGNRWDGLIDGLMYTFMGVGGAGAVAGRKSIAKVGGRIMASIKPADTPEKMPNRRKNKRTA